jgi:hypothetical protein
MEAPAQTVDQEQDAPSQPGSLRWLWWSGLFVAFYLLAAGPAAKLTRAHPAALPVVASVYAPLDALYQHSQFTRKLVDWYVEDVWRAK